VSKFWIPDPIWKDEDAIIIGGGTSLASFDFARLAGRNVIGVNDAFKLGNRIVQCCIFGDASWYHKNESMLPSAGMPIISVAPALTDLQFPWLHHLPREKSGLHKDRCGWNFCTGAAAVNLALLFGARRVFLLGFDMQSGADGRPHWHYYNDHKIKEFSFHRFQQGFNAIAADLVKFPGVRVFNVTEGGSRLAVFQKITTETFFRCLNETPKLQEVAA
jgi:hypothetical protein